MADAEQGSLRKAARTGSAGGYGSVERMTSSVRWGAPTREMTASLLQMRGKGMSAGLGGYLTPWSVLLIFVPLGVLAGMLDMSKTIIFITNFLGIIPLALVLGTATEDIALYTNETIGGLLNASFGNAVELIISINALRLGLNDLIKATLIGSILSNLLLVMGCAFLFGGFVFQTQEVSRAIVSSTTGLLAISVFAFTIPSVFALTSGSRTEVDRVSLLASIGLFSLYLMYLFYQLVTHKNLFEGVEEEEEKGSPNVSLPAAIAILLVTCGLVSWTSEYLVDSVEGFAKGLGLPSFFVSVILLPIVGNAAEHFSAVTVSMKGKLDLSVGIAIGSSVQIAAFVAPFMVIVSWIFGFPHLNLNFHAFETVILVLVVVVINVILSDLRTDWLEGAILLVAYIIVATAFFYY
mmetsp:Transcript_9978/g.26606  ORF Transcript_9978/g.26606 Transcript_9978/m.26606 type:complete len:408 (+) Transcript_9978:37-1260(+)